MIQSKRSRAMSERQQQQLERVNVREQLGALRQECSELGLSFQGFRSSTMSLLGEWAGKIGHLVFRQLKERLFLEGQIEKSRTIQQSMRGEVIKLKEMIQAAVEDYEKQLAIKNAILKEKDEEIQLLIKQIKRLEITRPQAEEGSIRIEESRQSGRESLQVIQEESEHATHSSAALSLREFKEEERVKIPETVIANSTVSCGSPVAAQGSPEKEKQNVEPREHKRTKTFIDHFRKTIGESFSEKNEEPPAVVVPSPSLKIKTPANNAQPLRELSSNQQSGKPPQSFSHTLKEAPKEPLVNVCFKTVGLHQSNSVSKSSSSSDLIANGEERINIPKKFETPMSLMFFKKKEAVVCRVNTEPSPQRHDPSYFSCKPAQSQKRIFHEKKSSCEKSRGNSVQQCKSVKSSLSREKIKITAKMVEEGVSAKKQGKALVYLGGKSVFRKFLLELKIALRSYSLNTALPELKYEGPRRGGVRWGQGRVLYQNGAVYQGEFKEGVRWGRGRLSLNGIVLYEGEWSADRVSGQGYVKSMRFMGRGGGAVFNEASYCGNLLEDRFHGIGTLFLNAKQKIVTKFQHGVPVGELTYYNFHEIEFGVWPSES